MKVLHPTGDTPATPAPKRPAGDDLITDALRAWGAQNWAGCTARLDRLHLDHPDTYVTETVWPLGLDRECTIAAWHDEARRRSINTVPPEPDGPDAEVIPINRPRPARETEPTSTEPNDAKQNEGEPPMTTTREQANAANDAGAEVVGLDQSIAYTEQLRAVATNHGHAGNEGYIGQLERGRNSGAVLATAAEMQEAFDAAAAAADRHLTELQRQKTVQEQYDLHPDAGDKDYQTAGR